MDSPAAFSSFFSFFLHTQLLPLPLLLHLLLLLLLYYRSRFLIRLKFSFYFFLYFFIQTTQAIVVVEEHKNQFFRPIYTYITYKLLPKPGRSNTLTWRVHPDQEIPDSFWGVPLKWVLRVNRKKGITGRFGKTTRYFELHVPHKLLAEVRCLYLQSRVMEEAARIRMEQHDPDQEAVARNDARFRWIPVIAGLLIQLIPVIAGLLVKLIGC